MDYQKINQKIDELTKSGLYDNKQLEAIKYACYIPDFDENLIINPEIPGNIMLTYVKLAKTHKINIEKYINDNWHLKGFNDNQLYYLIMYNANGYDISDITPNMDIKDIKEIMDSKDMEKHLDKLLIYNPKLAFLKEMHIDPKVIKFLLNKFETGYDISVFLRPDINSFSLDQIKYLFSIYSIGGDLNSIFDSNLSVEQMKERMLNSKESREFLQEINEMHNNRQK